MTEKLTKKIIDRLVGEADPGGDTLVWDAAGTAMLSSWLPARRAARMARGSALELGQAMVHRR